MRISKDNQLKRLLCVQDICFSVLSYLVAVNATYWTHTVAWPATKGLLLLTPVVLLMAVFASLRSVPQLRNRALIHQFWFSARHTFVVLGGFLLFLYLANVQLEVETTLVTFALILSSGLLVNRVFLRWWYLSRRRETKASYLKVLVIGAGPRARQLMSRYRRASEWGVDVVGILDPDPAYAGRRIDGVKVLGNLEAIEGVLAKRVIDEVVVCLPRRMIADLEPFTRACRAEGVCVKFMADLYDHDERGAIRLERIGAVPVLCFEPTTHDEARLITKRIVDLLLTLIALPLLLPVFLLAAIAIKLSSRGPVFFVQERVGLHKRRFRMLKFRSMCQDAEKKLGEIEHLNEAAGPIFKIARDPRVTAVGRFLRRTSIDELPQLFNVLMGEMSLVGPRPMSVRDVDRFSHALQRRRFSVPPGLICLREISGRSRLSFDRWLELDLQYIDEWSLWMDMKILMKAIPSILRGDGAH